MTPQDRGKIPPIAGSWRGLVGVALPCAGCYKGAMTQAAASNAFPAPEHDHDRCLAEAMERARKAFKTKGLKLTPAAPVGVPGDRRLAPGDRRLRGARQACRQGRAAGADLGLSGDRCPCCGRPGASLREPQCFLRLPRRPRDAPAHPGVRDVRARGRGRRRQGVRRHRHGGGLGVVRGQGCGGRGVGPVRHVRGRTAGARRMEGHERARSARCATPTWPLTRPGRHAHGDARSPLSPARRCRRRRRRHTTPTR